MILSKCLNGLMSINLELSSLCNKNCWMCGRRKIDKDYPMIRSNYGFMDFNLLEKIAKQVPKDITIQFHNNGEFTLYPYLKHALRLFKNNIRCADTNGKLLVKKHDDIINNMESLTVSIIENDPEWKEQYEILKEFITIKQNQSPQIVLRLLGSIEPERIGLYKDLHCIMVKRILHSPMGSFGYKKETVIPETGICLEVLHKLSISKDGFVSPCVRFDPNKEFIIGNVNTRTLKNIWNGNNRKNILKQHIEGKRKEISFCSKCDYWGVPTA